MLEAAVLSEGSDDEVSQIVLLERMERLRVRVARLEETVQAECDPQWLDNLTRVLLVEDDGEQRLALAEALRNRGFYVATAASGEEAVRYLHYAMEPDVVLMDISMPDCDGHEANSLMKCVRGSGARHTIAVTGLDRDSVNTEQFSAYFRKPISVDQLTETIKELVSESDREYAGGVGPDTGIRSKG